MNLQKKKDRPIHRISFESMIAWGCLCGGRFLNQNLKGKSDDDLILEREESFAQHQRDMEVGGW